ncbi:RNA polymerase 2, partial [Pisolithus orientalis]|uniref:RNA polymerase 2 n=1 Tax=Pisolithus orientalis TaxID=936130 RepID=UPI0022251979
QEPFFHAMAGQEGLIELAVKMVETGNVCYDGTVRNLLGDLIQLMYREDGMHDAFIIFLCAPPTNACRCQISVSQNRIHIVFARVLLNGACMHLCQPKSYPHCLCQGTPQWSMYAPLSAKIISTSSLPEHSLMKHVCTSVSENCWLVHIFHINCCKPSDLKPAYTVDAVHQLHGEVSREAQVNALLTFCMHIRATHATCHILEEFHLNHKAFEWVLDKIEAKFNHTLVNPGQMCSTVAAQSIGEPATQMTLNTFHYASVSSKNATLSVPHLKEIINVATNIKTLSPSVYLESYMAQDKKTPCSLNLSSLSLNQLLKVTLNAFHHAGVYNRNAKLGIPCLKEIINIATWYDPDPTSTIIKDSVFIEAFFAIVEPVTQMTLIQ